jgi:hypothetical protein
MRWAQCSVKMRRLSIFIDVVPQQDETPERPLLKFLDKLLCQVILCWPTVTRVAKHHKGPGSMHSLPGVRC